MAGTTEPDVHEATAEWYRRYYEKRGADRNDILRNSGVLFQLLSGDAALLRALARIGFDSSCARVLDVGGGSGGSLIPFLGLGMSASQLSCLDVQQDRVNEGRTRLPGVDFYCQDASALPFEKGSFDMVFSSTMFVQITDDAIASKIAHEMIRVTKPGGYVFIRDWVLSRPGDKSYSAVNLARLHRILPRNAKVLFRENGSLLPPLGRFLSSHASWAYFLIQWMFPFLVALKVNVIQVPAST